MDATHDDLDIDQEAVKTPLSRLYLRPKTEQVINCAMDVSHPIDVQEIKTAFSNSIMLKHPRFCSLLVRGTNGEFWKRTKVNIDDHFIIHHQHSMSVLGMKDDEKEAVINDYLADLAVSNPLCESKPLWEVHLLMGLNCLVLRVHHAIGDGVSLMSLLSACFGAENEGLEETEQIDGGRDCSNETSDEKKKWRQKGVRGFVKAIWFTAVFLLKILGRLLWVKDDASVVSGGDGIELWPRKLITAKFKLEDFNSIKKAIPNSTVNDVLLGVVSAALSKFLHIKSPNGIRQGIQISTILVVDLRRDWKWLDIANSLAGFSRSTFTKCIQFSTTLIDKRHEESTLLQPNEISELTNGETLSIWGNKTAFVLLPIDCCKGKNHLAHIGKMKAIMDQKKQSYEAHITYIALQFITTLLGPKVTSRWFHRLLCHTSLVVSNIMGPSKKIAIANNPIISIRVSVSSLPHAVTMHMVSYAGNVNLQVMVAKDIITDPDLLRTCFQESVIDMVKDLHENQENISFG